MSSTKATPLLDQEASLTWHMPISPSDYPDRNPLLSEAERTGVERLLSFSSWQWRAFDQQLACLSRITKPLLEVVQLVQRRYPNSFVSRQHFIGSLLGHVLQTNTLYWGWSSDMWETIIQSTPTRPGDVARRREPGQTSTTSPTLLLLHLATYLLTGRLYLTREYSFRCRALGEIVFGPELVQAAIDRAREPWVATGYSQRGRNLEDLIYVLVLTLLVNRHPSLEVLTVSALEEARALNRRKEAGPRFEQLRHVLIDLGIISDEGGEQSAARPPTMLLQDAFVQDIHPRWVAWIRAFWQQTPLSQRNRTEATGHVLLACRR
jgi:hypothetical protein